MSLASPSFLVDLRPEQAKVEEELGEPLGVALTGDETPRHDLRRLLWLRRESRCSGWLGWATKNRSLFPGLQKERGSIAAA